MKKVAGIIHSLERKGYRFRVIAYSGERIEVDKSSVSDKNKTAREFAALKELRTLNDVACKYLNKRNHRYIEKIRKELQRRVMAGVTWAP